MHCIVVIAPLVSDDIIYIERFNFNPFLPKPLTMYLVLAWSLMYEITKVLSRKKIISYSHGTCIG